MGPIASALGTFDFFLFLLYCHVVRFLCVRIQRYVSFPQHPTAYCCISHNHLTSRLISFFLRHFFGHFQLSWLFCCCFCPLWCRLSLMVFGFLTLFDGCVQFQRYVSFPSQAHCCILHNHLTPRLICFFARHFYGSFQLSWFVVVFV